ncbi:hypothetical protein PMIT1320_02165 [Prochlorococcus marinus str. MIT 1320]|nr:hypothetical protein PMIT1320_02165 [Prochlorococcus marinus str. MIT 1320]
MKIMPENRWNVLIIQTVDLLNTLCFKQQAEDPFAFISSFYLVLSY